MREIKYLNNLQKYDYEDYNTYDGNLDILNNLEDMLSEIEDDRRDNTQYISDLLTEIADNHIPVYDNEIWNEAQEIQEWVEETIEENRGLIKNDLIQTFQYAIFRYNELGLYANLNTIIYNLALLYLDKRFPEVSMIVQSRILELTPRDIKNAIEHIDGNSRVFKIHDNIENLIDNLDR